VALEICSPKFGQCSWKFGQCSQKFGQCSWKFGQCSQKFGQCSPKFGQCSPKFRRRSATFGRRLPELRLAVFAWRLTPSDQRPLLRVGAPKLIRRRHRPRQIPPTKDGGESTFAWTLMSTAPACSNAAFSRAWSDPMHSPSTATPADEISTFSLRPPDSSLDECADGIGTGPLDAAAGTGSLPQEEPGRGSPGSRGSQQRPPRGST